MNTPRHLLVALTFLTWALGLSPGLPGTARAESAAVPFVDVRDVTIAEGDDGTTAFTAEVRLFWPTAVTVDITAIEGTATAADFRFAPVRLTLVPGEVKTVAGVIHGDTRFEGDESFQLQATVAPSASYPYFISASGGRITIDDDDDARASRLTIAGISVVEGASGFIRHDLVVRLQPPSAEPVSVNYLTQGATASAPSDYIDTMGTLFFAPGETEKTAEVQVVGDVQWEPDEQFTVLLDNARGAIVATRRADVTITNDDPTAVLTAADVTVTEGSGGGSKLVPVIIHINGDAPLKVHVSVSGGAATPGVDHHGKFEVLYPTPKATSVTYMLAVVSDNLPECDEGVEISYAPIYAGIGPQQQVRVLIADDDNGPASCGNPLGNGGSGGPVEGGDGGAAAGPDGGAPADGLPRVPTPAAQPDDQPDDDGGCRMGRGHGTPGGLALTLLILGALAVRRRSRRG